MFLSWPSEVEGLRTPPDAGLDRNPQPTIKRDDRATALIYGGRGDPPRRMGSDLAAAVHPNTASRGGPA
jgi:hypothetical protein